MKYIRDEKASVMIISLLLMIVLVLLGASFFVSAINDARTAERQRRTTVAFAIAEAGIERAIYDLKQDFENAASSPSWADGDINGYAIGPDTVNFYALPYSSTALNGGSYTIQLRNIIGSNEVIVVQSTGTIGDAQQTIQVLVRITSISPWSNAIFAGTGQAGGMINGNVDIRGSVHILGTGLDPTDLVVDLGGTAELIGNNYTGLPAGLDDLVPALQTVEFEGETVETLNAVLRVKRGIVGLSGDASVGQPQTTGNAVKETIDAAYVTDGYGGNQAENNVFSDNGWSNAYDLGDALSFPSLSDPYPGYSSYDDYLKSNALVITDAAKLAELANVTAASNFSYSDAKGSIAVDGSGNMTISGIVYIGDNASPANLVFNDKKNTIKYSGSGVILATGNVQIDTNLITNGTNSFPTNVLGVMTQHDMTIGTLAQLDVMGLFYAENSIAMEKQTQVLGTIVSNYFNMGAQVPKIYQVPDTLYNLPLGMIGQDSAWRMQIVSWQSI